MKLIISALGMFTALTLFSVGAAQTVEKRGLTLDGEKKVIAAADISATCSTMVRCPRDSVTASTRQA